MAPNANETEAKTPRSSKDLVNTAAAQIKKAKADAFQQKAKELLQKQATAQAAVDAITADLASLSDAYDADL